MTRTEILVIALKRAIARGARASHIAQKSGVNPAVISRLMSGQQQDIMTEFYFSILDCLDDDIRKEALTRLGIKSEVDPQEMVKYLKGREIAKMIPFLDREDRGRYHASTGIVITFFGSESLCLNRVKSLNIISNK
jgi:hypothetical protein